MTPLNKSPLDRAQNDDDKTRAKILAAVDQATARLRDDGHSIEVGPWMTLSEFVELMRRHTPPPEASDDP